MPMHACPHCGGPGITTFRRFWLGPGSAPRCRTCRRKIGVPLYGMLALLPFPLGILAAPFLPGRLFLLAPLAGMIAMCWLWGYVPLVKR